MTEDGQKLAAARITNSPARLAAEIRRAGLTRGGVGAGYGWNWAADALAAAGAEVHLARPLGVNAFSHRRVKNDELDARDLLPCLAPPRAARPRGTRREDRSQARQHRAAHGARSHHNRTPACPPPPDDRPAARSVKDALQRGFAGGQVEVAERRRRNEDGHRHARASQERSGSGYAERRGGAGGPAVDPGRLCAADRVHAVAVARRRTITTQTHQIIGVSEGAVGDLAGIFPFVYVILALPAGRWLDARFARALGLGAVLTASGGLLRLASP